MIIAPDYRYDLQVVRVIDGDTINAILTLTVPHSPELMTHLIYTSVPYWEITRCSTTDPSLIRFVKHGRRFKLLDQVARWTGNGWDPARWCPDGKVPKDVMRQVVGELLRREVAE